MSEYTIEGGCFCGKVRYAIDAGEYTSANCHCSMCRKTSAAPYVTWLVVPTEHFVFTSGTVMELESSASGRRYFCPACGTPLTCTNTKHAGMVDVTVGSLDQPEYFPPTIKVHDDTQLTWVNDPTVAHRG